MKRPNPNHVNDLSAARPGRQDAFLDARLSNGIKWYRAVVPFGGVGAGHSREEEIILCGPDMVAALDALKSIPGWKKSREIPESITQIKAEAAIRGILAKIEATPAVTLSRVIKDGYFFTIRT